MTLPALSLHDDMDVVLDWENEMARGENVRWFDDETMWWFDDETMWWLDNKKIFHVFHLFEIEILPRSGLNIGSKTYPQK